MRKNRNPECWFQRGKVPTHTDYNKSNKGKIYSISLCFEKSENDLRSNARSHAYASHADAKHKNNENIALLVDTTGKTKWIIHSDTLSHISNSREILRWQTLLKLTS